MKAPVNRIIPFSNVDGPGNRCAVFFQSCPFHCLFCHNPETIHMCMNCGECVDKCPEKALKMSRGKVIWNPDKCVSCDTCIHVCRHLASPKIRWMDTKAVMKEIEPLLPYIEGITVSGGECMEYADFLLELFTEVKKKNRTCLIDSNGAFDFDRYPELMKVCDGVMLDVKAYGHDYHQWLTGMDNDIVLHNLSSLQKQGKLYEVRTVCCPGRHKENEETVREVSKLLDPNIRYKLIKYRPFGVREEGLEKIGRTITEDKEISALQKTAKRYGMKNIVIV